jgi:hypothetical protein
MPELQGYPLHPFRVQQGHVGVAVMLAFIGQKLQSDFPVSQASPSSRRSDTG